MLGYISCLRTSLPKAASLASQVLGSGCSSASCSFCDEVVMVGGRGRTLFQANFSGEVTADVVASSIFSIYRTSQLVMLEYSVRLRLEVPTVNPYSFLLSH